MVLVKFVLVLFVKVCEIEYDIGNLQVLALEN